MDDLFSAQGQKRGPWPSEQLVAYLSGNDTAPSPAILSWSSFHIYDAAMQVCRIDTREKRRMALGKIPAAIRPLVETEIKRLWPLR